jgi:hypothetical protein
LGHYAAVRGQKVEKNGIISQRRLIGGPLEQNRQDCAGVKVGLR